MSNDLPKFFRVRQQFPSLAVDDAGQSAREALERSGVASRISAGQHVAITAGSRGIKNIATIVGATVAYVKSLGAKPLVVPAMGSHGGATAEGQASMLRSFGIDESTMGCPIRATMDTVVLGQTEQGFDIHFDKICSEVDHVIVVNRVKPHTRLVGTIESGICKMLMIGLGKHRGAQTYHHAFDEVGYSLDPLLPNIIPKIVDAMPITLGLAIVEDAFDQTSLIQAVEPQRLLEDEPPLLEIARSRMPRLPFEDADLLIVDQIGKEISGTGMDTNVIGRKRDDKRAGPNEVPKIREIYVRSLTKKSAGNGCGIGIAEYCHRQFVDDMNQAITRINCVTSGHPTAGAIPIHFNNDRDVIQAVMSQVGRRTAAQVRWMRIVDTLHLEEVWCSEGYWDDAQTAENVQVLGQPQPLEFDSAGDFC